MKFLGVMILATLVSPVLAKDYTVDSLAIYETHPRDPVKLDVLVGRLASNNAEYLIEFIGKSHKYHGQVLHYTAKSPSSTSKTLNYHLSSTKLTPLRDKGQSTLVDGSFVPFIESYVDRKKIKLFRATKMNTAVFYETQSISALLTSRYLHKQGFDRKLTFSEAVDSLNVQVLKTQQACHKKTQFSIDIDDSFNEKTGSNLKNAEQYLSALKSLCEQDPDYQDVIRALVTFEFSYSEKPVPFSIKKNKGTLSVVIARSHENTALFAKAWLESHL